MRIDDVYQLGVALGGRQMWIDRHVGKKTEACRPFRRHQQRLVRPAAHSERTQNDGASGTAENNTTPVEKRLSAICVRVPRYASASRPEFPGVKYTPVAESSSATNSSLSASLRRECEYLASVNNIDAIGAEPSF